MKTPNPTPAGTTYVVVVREHSIDLALEYPDLTTAIAQMEDSLTVQSICEDDSLDVYIPEWLDLDYFLLERPEVEDLQEAAA